jgi:hypothetical protein
VPLFDRRTFADVRELNDRAYALDHFQTKLLRLPETMQTDAGQQRATECRCSDPVYGPAQCRATRVITTASTPPSYSVSATVCNVFLCYSLFSLIWPG